MITLNTWVGEVRGEHAQKFGSARRTQRNPNISCIARRWSIVASSTIVRERRPPLAVARRPWPAARAASAVCRPSARDDEGHGGRDYRWRPPEAGGGATSYARFGRFGVLITSLHWTRPVSCISANSVRIA